VLARGDTDAPMGPGVEEEAAFFAAQRATETTRPASGPGEPEEAPDNNNLPPLDTLVNRIPAEARAVLDELFRAKFTTVRRVPETALKPQR